MSTDDDISSLINVKQEVALYGTEEHHTLTDDINGNVKIDEANIPVTIIAANNGDIVATATYTDINGVPVAAEPIVTTENVTTNEDDTEEATESVAVSTTGTEDAETPLANRTRQSTHNKDNRVDSTSTPTLTAANGETLVTEIRPQDVLFGRGGNAIHHSGNISFRTLIQEKKQIYTSSCRRQVKDMVAVEVYTIVTENGGRFLRESTSAASDLPDTYETPSGSKSGKIWTIADQQTSINKIKQALREVDTNTTVVVAPNVPTSVHGVEFVSVYNPVGTPNPSSGDTVADEDASLPRKKRKYTKTTAITYKMPGTSGIDNGVSTSNTIRTYTDSSLQVQLNDFKDSIQTMLEQLFETQKQELLSQIREMLHGPKMDHIFDTKNGESTTKMETEETEYSSVKAEDSASATMESEHPTVEL